MKYTSKLLKEIMKKYNIKEKSKIDLELINKIIKNENISLKDLRCMLQITDRTMYGLRKNKQKYTKIKLNKYDGLENKSIIEDEKITYEDFKNLQKENNLKAYTLIRTLGISRYKYKKLKAGEIEKVRIKDVKTKHIVDLIKIDLSHMANYEDKYFPKKDLIKLCRQRKINLDKFAKYYDNNIKHYEFNKMVIKNSLKGFYIGGECEMPYDFFESNYEKIQKQLKKVANRVSGIIGTKQYKEDFIQESIWELYKNCGNIVKKFYFNAKVMFGILMAKAKYFMLNLYRKKYKEYKNIYIDSYENNFLEHTSILRDNTYSPELLFE